MKLTWCNLFNSWGIDISLPVQWLSSGMKKKTLYISLSIINIPKNLDAIRSLKFNTEHYSSINLTTGKIAWHLRATPKYAHSGVAYILGGQLVPNLLPCSLIKIITVWIKWQKNLVCWITRQIHSFGYCGSYAIWVA